ncbi:hypothetical protein Trydic_g15208 [Trypoxylus dichotomus]
MPLSTSFQHDNDPKRIAQLVANCISAEKLLSSTGWLSRLIPIENLWEIRNRRIDREGIVGDKDMLYEAAIQAWLNIPPEVINNLICQSNAMVECGRGGRGLCEDDLRSGKFQIVLTGTNPSSCVGVSHGLDDARRGTGHRRRPDVVQDLHLRLMTLKSPFSNIRPIVDLWLGNEDRLEPFIVKSGFLTCNLIDHNLFYH